MPQAGSTTTSEQFESHTQISALGQQKNSSWNKLQKHIHKICLKNEGKNSRSSAWQDKNSTTRNDNTQLVEMVRTNKDAQDKWFLSFFFLKILFIYFRERWKEGGREGEKHQLETGLQPRHVLWLETKPATFWSEGWHSIHWATPARAEKVLNANRVA